MRFLKWLLGAAIVLAIAAFAVWFSLQPPHPLRTALDAFSLIDVTVITPGIERGDHQVLTVRDGRIESLQLHRPTGGPVALSEFRGHYVLPGLVDLHVHLPPDTPLQLTGHNLFLYLLHGVTAVREVGDVDGTAVPAARRLLASEASAGPRVFACGPFIAGGTPRWKNTVVVRSNDEIRATVARLRQEGFNCLKSYDDLTASQIRVLAEAGREAGMPVLGHLPTAVAYEESFLDEVQHLHGVVPPERLDPSDPASRSLDWESVDDTRIAQFVETSVKRRIAHTPTLVAAKQLLGYRDYPSLRVTPLSRLLPRLYADVLWSPTDGLPGVRRLDTATVARLEGAFQKKQGVVRELAKAGGLVLVGTDVSQPFVVPGASVHEEMRLLAEAGMPVEQVWASATWRAGTALRMPQLGRAEAGAPADLLIFAKDPTRDLAALDSMVAVVAGGKLYRKVDLDAAQAAYRHHFDGWFFDRISTLATKRIVTQIANEH